MKSEFIPSQFKESSGECKICDARKEFERLLSEESDLLLSCGTALFAEAGGDRRPSADLVQSYLQVGPSLGDALTDYRVCFAQNLALYFTAERHGRLRKVPEFLGACDEYRERALASLQEFDQAFERFKTVFGSYQENGEALQKLVAAHDLTMKSARAFWEQIDIWTQTRNKTAQDLFGASK